jgi:2-oxo-4-hydroxy-4-carboxy-5-ureidoimidazoline decarboxylase
MDAAEVAWLDGLPFDEAVSALSSCCASSRWTRRVAAARPYRTWAALLDQSNAMLRELSWADVLEALSAHPMIGRRVEGASTEAAWSRSEQSGMDGAPRDVAERLAELNLAYQEKFGHVFLLCASGLPAEVMLRALEHRLRNDAAAEQRETRTELAAITRLRLERLVATGAEAREVRAHGVTAHRVGAA